MRSSYRLEETGWHVTLSPLATSVLSLAQELLIHSIGPKDFERTQISTI
jgi:hypothetical protein